MHAGRSTVACRCAVDLTGSCGGLKRVGGAAKGSPRYLCTILEAPADWAEMPCQIPVSRVTVSASCDGQSTDKECENFLNPHLEHENE